MRSEGYSTWYVILSVCPSVRLSGTTYSGTTHNKAAKKRYQRVQCHTGLIFKIAIFVKVLRSKVMASKPSEQANMLMSMAQILPVSSTVEAVEGRVCGPGLPKTLPRRRRRSPCSKVMA